MIAMNFLFNLTLIGRMASICRLNQIRVCGTSTLFIGIYFAVLLYNLCYLDHSFNVPDNQISIMSDFSSYVFLDHLVRDQYYYFLKL